MTPGAAPQASATRWRGWLSAWCLLAAAAALALVLALSASAAPAALWALAAVVALGLGAALSRPSPLAVLAGVLALQVLQLQGGEGASAGEAIAGLALVIYLAYWYGMAVASGRPLVRTLFDAAALAWGTVGFAVAVGLGLMFGPEAYDFRADVIATVPFALYLPVKEACAKHDRGGVVVAAVLCGLGVVATAQNVLALRTVVTSSDALYEIADARFNTGETAITAGLMVALATAAMARQRAVLVLAVGAAGLLLSGLVLAKSRGFWVSAAFGVAAMVIVAPGRDRRRILGYGALGVVGVVGIGVAVLGDQLLLLALGVLDRLVTVGSAGNDLSLVNRVVESRAVWDRIVQNPVLGHGWGVQVTHYSLTSEGTRSWAFFHNGYLSLWFKTGLWGLGLVMAVWLGAIARTVRAARLVALRAQDRALALGAGATLAAFTPVAVTSNPFSVLDQMLVVTVVLALAHGVSDRADVLRQRLLSAAGAAGP